MAVGGTYYILLYVKADGAKNFLSDIQGPGHAVSGGLQTKKMERRPDQGRGHAMMIMMMTKLAQFSATISNNILVQITLTNLAPN